MTANVWSLNYSYTMYFALRKYTRTIHYALQSNLSDPDSYYPGTPSTGKLICLFYADIAGLLAIQWVWPITAYVFISYYEIRTNLSYGHPLIPRCPEKKGLTVNKGSEVALKHVYYKVGIAI